MVPMTGRTWLLTWLAICVALVGLGGASATPPASTPTDDYAAQELGSSWDMSDPTTIPFEFTRRTGNVSGLTLANGVLQASATTSDPRVTLLLPSEPSANPVVPEGGLRPIDTSVYRYLTVRVNVPSVSNAQVFWQTGQGTAFNGSAFKTVNPGWNVITFDLAGGGNGSSGAWSGLVQGLYFDPMTTTGPFQIDYVQLSSSSPADPNNQAPRLNITAPSYTSGPDYATVERGNPWDMSDASDVAATNAIAATFSDGLLNGSTANCSGASCGDPQIMLAVGPRIDTSRYKYLTVRMKLDGEQDTGNGSVARVLWWSTIPQEATVMSDWVIYEGWRTVSFDMTKVKLVQGAFATWANSNPNVFRFDPHEFQAPKTFQIDNILLTGDSQANSSFNIRYQATDADGDSLTVRFYYDSDAQGFDGQLISCSTGGPAPGSFRMYLPTMASSGTAGSPVEGSTCRWDSAAIPAGRYYIYGVASDGKDSTRIYGQTPVLIQH